MCQETRLRHPRDPYFSVFVSKRPTKAQDTARGTEHRRDPFNTRKDTLSGHVKTPAKAQDTKAKKICGIKETCGMRGGSISISIRSISLATRSGVLGRGPQLA